MVNIYIDLTRQFNAGKTRAILSSGQAVVLHRLAIMSKDGDWILREEPETLGHTLGVLSQYGAQYRFGAPLDVRWMAGDWSSHFEFCWDPLRIRTDFITSPPRISQAVLRRLWMEQEGKEIPFVDVKTLVEIKKRIGKRIMLLSESWLGYFLTRKINSFAQGVRGTLGCLQKNMGVFCQSSFLNVLS